MTQTYLNDMNVWMWAALFMLLSYVPAGIVCFRGEMEDRLIGMELVGCLTTIELVLLCEGTGRASFYDLPITLAFLSFGGGMVFARFAQRWL